ncbi:MAG: hypothetical protein PHP50_11495 [Lachnospiraceae bacterium]|nr:hypothetical protein [Lachnospiraceae bacterium]
MLDRYSTVKADGFYSRQLNTAIKNRNLSLYTSDAKLAGFNNIRRYYLNRLLLWLSEATGLLEEENKKDTYIFIPDLTNDFVSCFNENLEVLFCKPSIILWEYLYENYSKKNDKTASAFSDTIVNELNKSESLSLSIQDSERLQQYLLYCNRKRLNLILLYNRDILKKEKISTEISDKDDPDMMKELVPWINNSAFQTRNTPSESLSKTIREMILGQREVPIEFLLLFCVYCFKKLTTAGFDEAVAKRLGLENNNQSKVKNIARDYIEQHLLFNCRFSGTLNLNDPFEKMISDLLNDLSSDRVDQFYKDISDFVMQSVLDGGGNPLYDIFLYSEIYSPGKFSKK